MSYALFKDLLIPFFVGGGVFVFFCFFAERIRRVNKLLKREFSEASSFLAKIQQHEVGLKFRELDVYFREKPTFEHAWHEFEESLVRSTSVGADGVQTTAICNTIPAHEFFSHEELVDSRLGTEVNRHIPGVFTAVGILGTFMGIGLGLWEAKKDFALLNVAPTAVIQPTPSQAASPGLKAKGAGSPTAESGRAAQTDGIQNDAFRVVNSATTKLIGHIGPAFMASFLAVLFAVLFICLERYVFRALEEELLRLQLHIDRIFPRLTQHELLLRLIKHADQQEASLKHLSEDFATRLEEKLPTVFGHAMGAQTEMLRTTFNENTSAMSTTLAQAFAPLTEQLSQTLVEMKKDQASSSTDTLRQMADSFQNSLSQAAGGQFDEMAKAISGTSELLSSQKHALADFVTTIGQQMDRQASSLAAQMEQQRTESEARQRESNARFQELIGQLSGTFAGLQQDAVSNSSALLSDMSSGIQGLLQETMQNQRVANQALMQGLEESNSKLARSLAELTQGLEQMSERITQSTDALVERLRESTGATVAHLSSTVQGATETTVKEVSSSTSRAVEQIAAETSKLFSASEEQNRKLTEKFQTMATAFESSVQSNSSKAVETTKVLESALGQVNKLAGDVTGMVQAVQQQISSLSQVALNARESAAEFKAVSVGLAAQQQKSEATLEAIRTVEKAVATQSKMSEGQRESMQQAFDGFKAAANTLAQSAGEQRKTLSEVASNSTHRLREFDDGVNATVKNLANATQGYLRQVDEALSKATSQLAGTVEDLREPLEELVDALSSKR